MKLGIAASLALLLLPAAIAQKPARNYLIRLSDSDFPAGLRAKGITPLQHLGNVWAVRTSDEEILRQTTEDVTPADSVTIELQPGAKDITRAIADVGGVVTRTYHSICKTLSTSTFHHGFCL
jgi:hypothetical protein